MHIQNTVKIKFRFLLLLLVAAVWPHLAHAEILFDGAQTGGQTNDDSYVIDYDQSSAGNIDLQFGTSTRYLRWTGTKFQVSNDLDLNSNQITSARIENVTALPGGGGGLGAGAVGRVVQLTVVDGTAPGCTSPTCSPGSYSWDGTTWHSLQGSITTSNASKIITVGPSGRDYTTITAGAAYLNTLSGGEMWIDPGNYTVATPIDLSNIRVKGADSTLTTIDLTGTGKMTVKDTKFEDAQIFVDTTSSAMGLDVKYVAGSNSSVEFNRMAFNLTTGKVLMDSTATPTPPVAIVTFQESNQNPSAGMILKSVATANLNTGSSKFTVINLLTTNALQMVDWPVTIVGGSNVVTSGTITSVPDRTILVSPGMNIQAAINSLGANGGVIKLLIGTHTITNEITINNNNIRITGEGPGTIVQTGTWAGGTTVDNCAIQVGAANGTSPRTNIIVDNFQMKVAANIHGICVNGGSENKVMDMEVQSTGVKSGTRTAIVFTDGATTAGARFTATRSIINSDIAADRWVDGVHFDGNAALAGQLFGYGNGISDSIISEMIVNEASETSYAFAQVSASGVFSNRARTTSFNTGSFGMFFNNDQDVEVINNTLEGANNAASTGIGLNDNVDNSIFIGNAIRGGPTNFNVGIAVSNAASSGNIIANNQIENATTKITNTGTNTKLETLHTRATVDPTATDDISKGYDIGTIWLNTTTQATFISMVSTAGAAVWSNLLSGNITGTPSNIFTLDNDSTGGDVTLKFGQTNGETLTWDNANLRFDLSDDLNINGGLTMDGNTLIMDNDNSGGNVALQFGQTLNKTLSWNSANARFTFNDAVNVGGAFSMQTGSLAFPAGGGNEDNVVIPNNSIVRVTGPTSVFAIRGIAGGYDGRFLILENTTAVAMTISNQNTNSTAANRIITNTGLDEVTVGTGIAILVYDATDTRWKVIAFTP